MSNVSTDLIWEICRSNNAYLVKRKTGGGVQFSRDPLNLLNKHSRTYEGFVDKKAISVQPAEKGGVKLLTKKREMLSKPAESMNETTWHSGKANRKTYRSIVRNTAAGGYRPDLRAAAVARASAILYSQRRKKDIPARKPRGAKARKAAEKAAESKSKS